MIIKVKYIKIQYENLYYNHRNAILNFVNINYTKRDIFTIHIRLDDFGHFNKLKHCIISRNYYLNIIKIFGENCRDVHIVCEKPKQNWEKDYLSKLKKSIKLLGKNPIYKESSMIVDMMTIMSSNYIVMSNSTFAFWAAFFSQADKIISFPFTGKMFFYRQSKVVNDWFDSKLGIYRDSRYVDCGSFSNSPKKYFEEFLEF